MWENFGLLSKNHKKKLIKFIENLLQALYYFNFFSPILLLLLFFLPDINFIIN